METWLPVAGYEGRYEVSDAGRVRSLGPRGRVLRPGTNGSGYLVVVLFLAGVRDKRYVHHLVAEAFVGPRPAGHVIRHLDDNPGNNTPRNLAYGTTAQNNRDMSLHGRHWKGREERCVNGHPFDYWNGRQRVCRTCRNARVAEWNKRNPDYVPAWKRRKRRERKAAASTTQGSSPR